MDLLSNIFNSNTDTSVNDEGKNSDFDEGKVLSSYLANIIY